MLSDNARPVSAVFPLFFLFHLAVTVACGVGVPIVLFFPLLYVLAWYFTYLCVNRVYVCIMHIVCVRLSMISLFSFVFSFKHAHTHTHTRPHTAIGLWITVNLFYNHWMAVVCPPGFASKTVMWYKWKFMLLCLFFWLVLFVLFILCLSYYVCCVMFAVCCVLFCCCDWTF